MGSSTDRYHKKLELKYLVTESEKARETVRTQIKKLSWNQANITQVRKAAANGNGTYFPKDTIGNKQSDPNDNKICNVISEYIRQAFSLQGKPTDFRAWAQLRETVFTPPNDQVMWPGYVFRSRHRLENKPTWLLCISPLCDCYRPKKDKYLFIGGTAVESELPLHASKKCRKHRSALVIIGLLGTLTELLMEKDPLKVPPLKRIKSISRGQ